MRYQDWQARFWKAIEEALKQPFAWGEHDCVLFAAKMADAISDRDYTIKARLACDWSSAKEALKLTKDGLSPLVESVLGPPVPWVRLSQGDIALVVDENGKESLAVHDGCQVMGPDEVGLKVIPFRYVKAGWKID